METRVEKLFRTGQLNILQERESKRTSKREVQRIGQEIGNKKDT